MKNNKLYFGLVIALLGAITLGFSIPQSSTQSPPPKRLWLGVVTKSTSYKKLESLNLE